MIWLGVSGAHRSGTTILSHILNLHPEIGIFVEYGLEHYVRAIDAVFDRSDEIEDYDHRVDVARAAANDRDCTGFDETAERMTVPLSRKADNFYKSRDEKLGLGDLGPFRPVRNAHNDQLLLAPYQMAFPGRKLRVVGDKMPQFRDKNDVDWLQRRLSNFKLLHIVRNPLDVINSSLARRNRMRAGMDIWHVSTVREAADEWVREWNWALTAKRRLGDSMLIVKYEDMAADPERVLADIAKFLGLSTPLSPAFVPLPRELRLYALDEDERKAALAWLQPVASIWDGIPPDQLQSRLGALPSLLSPEDPILFQGDGNSHDYIWSGFSDPESSGRWTDGKFAQIRGNFGFDRHACRLELRLKAIAYCQKVAVKINDAVIGTLDMGAPTWEDREFSLDFTHPPADLGGTRLGFEIDRPKMAGEDPAHDNRSLGLFFQSIRLKTTGKS